MTHIVEKDGKKYIEGAPEARFINSVQDVVDLIGKCGEHDIDQVLLHPENVSGDFFDLRTGFAGEVLQKFMNYGVRLAALFREDQMTEPRFKEMVRETNRSRNFRVFSKKEDAEEWLLNEWWINRCKSH